MNRNKPSHVEAMGSAVMKEMSDRFESQGFDVETDECVHDVDVWRYLYVSALNLTVENVDLHNDCDECRAEYRYERDSEAAYENYLAG